MGIRWYRNQVEEILSWGRFREYSCLDPRAFTARSWVSGKQSASKLLASTRDCSIAEAWIQRENFREKDWCELDFHPLHHVLPTNSIFFLSGQILSFDSFEWFRQNGFFYVLVCVLMGSRRKSFCIVWIHGISFGCNRIRRVLLSDRLVQLPFDVAGIIAVFFFTLHDFLIRLAFYDSSFLCQRRETNLTARSDNLACVGFSCNVGEYRLWS